MNEIKRNLPTIKELYSDDLIILDKQNELNIILNQEPKKEWLKEHPIVKINSKPIKYIPIERIEWLLTNIFIRWRWEIIREGLIANSVYVSGRLHYLNPITNEWDWSDGIGAQPLQTDAGAGATEFNKIKSSAVQIGLPAAESYAFKDAAEKIGKLFGKDMNRADRIGYDSLYNKFAKIETETEEQTNNYMKYLAIIDSFDNAKELKNQTDKILNELKELNKLKKLLISQYQELQAKLQKKYEQLI